MTDNEATKPFEKPIDWDERSVFWKTVWFFKEILFFTVAVAILAGFVSFIIAAFFVTLKGIKELTLYLIHLMGG